MGNKNVKPVSVGKKTPPEIQLNKKYKMNKKEIKTFLTWDMPADDMPFFHGVLPRSEINTLLKQEGQFLLRKSADDPVSPKLIISVYSADAPRHVMVLVDPYGNFKTVDDFSFKSMHHLFYYHLRKGKPIYKDIRLGKPVLTENWQLRNENIVLGRELDKGQFGKVYLATLKPDNIEVAVKQLNLDIIQPSNKDAFLTEARLMRQYKHKNVVRVIGVAASANPIMIVMEWMAEGSMHKYLQKHNDNITPKTRSNWCIDIVQGMAYLESKLCIHRDLAARNCLLAKDLTAKIADFGLSREGEIYKTGQGNQIPVRWTAPEALLNSEFSSKSDVWSYGVLIWEIYSNGEMPYPGLGNDEIIKLYRNANNINLMEPPTMMPENIASIMARCWKIDPKERPSFADLEAELLKLYKR